MEILKANNPNDHISKSLAPPVYLSDNLSMRGRLLACMNKSGELVGSSISPC